MRSVTRIAFLMLLVFTTGSFGGIGNPTFYALFAAAIKNKSNVQYYAVIKAVDMNRNTVREICAPGSFIRSALHKEMHYDYDNQSVALVEQVALLNSERYFEFKNPEALQLLGVDAYTDADLEQLQTLVNFATLAKEIRKEKRWSKDFTDDREMLLYAHALFNQGILTGEKSDKLGTLVLIYY